MAEHQQFQELLAMQALDALDAGERTLLEAHLAECSACRVALIEWRDAAGLLAHGARPTAPSDGLRARILASVRAETRSLKSSETSARVVPMPQRKSNMVM